ncbi:MAG: hypothetical protein KDC13_09670, partial [Bacteroidetes bacterium]|nr:hypothetical protein [Bacteroidota bacterium]
MQIKFIVFLFAFLPAAIFAQPGDDLSKMLEEEMASEPITDYATATFKTTRLVNAHTNEQLGGGVLDMRISHRFGPVNSGIQNFFGLDQATMRVALEYGITDWLMIGGGRSTYEKTYDSFLKVKLMRQSKGHKARPLSINYLASWQTKTI